MSETQSIPEVLANLILQRNVPLKAVAIAGETIAVYARLLSQGKEPAKPSTGEDLGQILEAHEALLQRCERTVSEFLERRDGHALILGLSEIKQAIDALGPIPLYSPPLGSGSTGSEK